MGIARIINRHLPVDTQAVLAHGQLLGLLIAMRLDSPVALSNVAEWAATSGADILFDVPAKKLCAITRVVGGIGTACHCANDCAAAAAATSSAASIEQIGDQRVDARGVMEICQQ